MAFIQLAFIQRLYFLPLLHIFREDLIVPLAAHTTRKKKQQDAWRLHAKLGHLFTMLYLIGLGLGDESDITRRGLEVVKGCKRILLESYTSILPGISKESVDEL